MVSSEATVLSDRHGQHIAISTIDRTYATPMLVTRSMAMWRRPETPIRDIKQFGISGDGMPGELASAGLRKPKTGDEGPTHTKKSRAWEKTVPSGQPIDQGRIREAGLVHEAPNS
jgi:hypothetical protein